MTAPTLLELLAGLLAIAVGWFLVWVGICTVYRRAETGEWHLTLWPDYHS